MANAVTQPRRGRRSIARPSTRAEAANRHIVCHVKHLNSRMLEWLSSATMTVRLNLAYSIWVVIQIPILLAIWRLMEEWDYYRLCLATPVVSWHAGLCFYGRSYSPKARPKAWLFVIGLVILGIALMVQSHIMWAAVISMVGLTLLRIALTGENLRQATAAGVIILPFMLPIPLETLGNTSSILINLHSNLVSAIIEQVTGLVPIHMGPEIILTPLHSVVFIRECAGVTSLVGLMMFSLYFSTQNRHGRWLALLLMLGAIELAVFLNLLRVTSSGLMKLAESAFWTAPVGHELLGYLFLVLGVLALKIVASMLILDDKTAV